MYLLTIHTSGRVRHHHDVMACHCGGHCGGTFVLVGSGPSGKLLTLLSCVTCLGEQMLQT